LFLERFRYTLTDLPLADRLHQRALELAHLKAAEWRESEREAGQELAALADAHADGRQSLRAARERLAQELLGEGEGDPSSVLAHRLLQLALAADESVG
jgi:hypothetical protein